MFEYINFPQLFRLFSHQNNDEMNNFSHFNLYFDRLNRFYITLMITGRHYSSVTIYLYFIIIFISVIKRLQNSVSEAIALCFAFLTEEVCKIPFNLFFIIWKTCLNLFVIQNMFDYAKYVPCYLFDIPLALEWNTMAIKMETIVMQTLLSCRLRLVLVKQHGHHAANSIWKNSSGNHSQSIQLKLITISF